MPHPDVSMPRILCDSHKTPQPLLGLRPIFPRISLRPGSGVGVPRTFFQASPLSPASTPASSGLSLPNTGSSVRGEGSEVGSQGKEWATMSQKLLNGHLGNKNAYSGVLNRCIKQGGNSMKGL